MRKVQLACTVIAVIIILTLTQNATTTVQLTVAPVVSWQNEYGSQVNFASNLVQTSDGGYVFMDLGYGKGGYFKPSIIIKVDSNGTMQWNKTIDYFTGMNIIQTNDQGYEMTGWWNAYWLGPYAPPFTPTLINTDSQGTIQRIQNYTTTQDLPKLIQNSNQTYPFIHESIGLTQTSEGGSIFWNVGNITKTDSKNNTQWVKTLTFPTVMAYPANGFSLEISPVIETSDGALAVLGVAHEVIDNPYIGEIYLTKTEAFLPLPTPTQLSTSLPTPSPVPSQATAINPELLTLIAILVITIVVVSMAAIFFKRRKSESVLLVEGKIS